LRNGRVVAAQHLRTMQGAGRSDGWGGEKGEYPPVSLNRKGIGQAGVIPLFSRFPRWQLIRAVGEEMQGKMAGSQAESPCSSFVQGRLHGRSTGTAGQPPSLRNVGLRDHEDASLAMCKRIGSSDHDGPSQAISDDRTMARGRLNQFPAVGKIRFMFHVSGPRHEMARGRSGVVKGEGIVVADAVTNLTVWRSKKNTFPLARQRMFREMNRSPTRPQRSFQKADVTPHSEATQRRPSFALMKQDEQVRPCHCWGRL